MECLGVEPGAAWWKAQTNPLRTSNLFEIDLMTEDSNEMKQFIYQTAGQIK